MKEHSDFIFEKIGFLLERYDYTQNAMKIEIQSKLHFFKERAILG